MLEFLNSNPLIALAIGVVVTFVLMFIFVKPGKSKKKKDNKKTDSKKEQNEKTDKSEKVETEQPVKTDESNVDSEQKETLEEKNKVSKSKKKVHKSKSKPEITQVYKRTEGSEKVTVKEDEKDFNSDDDLEKRAQFVKTSSKVSKFMGLSDISQIEEAQDIVNQEFSESVTQEPQEDCEICEKIIKHFDHSRRLSKMVQENSFDDMLEAHISDHYLKMDVDRHLGLGNDFSEKLLERTLKTLANSDVKVLANSDNGEEKPVERIRSDKEYMRTWLENKRREELNKLMAETNQPQGYVVNEELEAELKDDIDLSPKNIMVVDSILNRKGKNKRT